MTDAATGSHLQTKYVFLDTQSFKKEQFDWRGKRFGKLIELAKEGHLILLTTDITKREVRAQIQEGLAAARVAAARHRVVHQQLGHDALSSVMNETGAEAVLLTEFDRFLAAARAVTVPISCTTDELFDDYFNQRPPFSEKKKSEFPDAAVVSSLKKWCGQRRASAYVVSEDPDMKACCTEGGILISSDSIGDILSRAAIAQNLYQALLKAVADSDYLSDSIADQLRELEVVISDLAHADFIEMRSGKMERLDDIGYHYIEVTDTDGNQLTCDIEFEAEIVLDLEIEFQGHSWGDDYEPSYTRSFSPTVHQVFSGQIVVQFDEKDPDGIDFESIYVLKSPIEVSYNDLTGRWSSRRFR